MLALRRLAAPSAALQPFRARHLWHLTRHSSSRSSTQYLRTHSPISTFRHTHHSLCTVATHTGTSSSSSSSSSCSSSQTVSSDSWVPSLARAIPGHSSTVDPFRLVSSDLDIMTRSIRATVSVLQHPALDQAASHLLSLHGKRIRPIIVLLMAHSTKFISTTTSATSVAAAATATSVAATPFLLPSQLRLAEITELIHAASLLHDDVIDVADKRRGTLSVNSLFGNQLAVLAGDFLLARASVALARLRDCDVVELLSTVIEHLVRGEVIQMRGGVMPSGGIADPADPTVSAQPDGKEIPRHETGDATLDWFHRPSGPFETYLAKTFFKTASLVANSCRAVTMLAGHDREVANAAYHYGENVGMAFQLIDDVLDIDGQSHLLGKPVLHDLKQGIVTAPVLFAMEQFPELNTLAQRSFSQPGDVDLVVQRVIQADGVKQTRDLARRHIEQAIDQLVRVVPPSDYRSALINLADFIIRRER